jgi:hypothetical protein
LGPDLRRAKFTGRLQLAPDLVPPTSWSLPLLRASKFASERKIPVPNPALGLGDRDQSV